MRNRRHLSALALLGILPRISQAQGSFPSDSAVLSIIKQRVEEKRSAGIVVGMLGADGKTRVVAYGDPGPGKLPLDANSVFEIGSISKVFTSTVLAQLVAEGKVRLDDPVRKYLPAEITLPVRNGKEITVVSLSEQNSGLPRMPANFHPADARNPYADYTVAQMYAFISGYSLTRDPGEQFEYSNLGVGLLGHTLALINKQTYEQMEAERVWKPLGMTHTAITLTPWMQQHLALGHNDAGAVTSNWDIPTLAGAGAIRSTTADMLLFADANLHPERGPLQRAMHFAQQPRALAGNATTSIGLNWIVQKVGQDTIVWHNGGTGGYRTFIGLMPTQRTAVVIMTNSGNAGADDIGLHLLAPVVPLAPIPQPVRQHTAVELPSALLSHYVGVYQMTPAFAIEVALDNGILTAQATGQGKFRLWPESEKEFFVKDFDAQVTFVTDENGAISSLILHQGGGNQSARKIR